MQGSVDLKSWFWLPRWAGPAAADELLEADLKTGADRFFIRVVGHDDPAWAVLDEDFDGDGHS